MIFKNAGKRRKISCERVVLLGLLSSGSTDETLYVWDDINFMLLLT